TARRWPSGTRTTTRSTRCRSPAGPGGASSPKPDGRGPPSGCSGALTQCQGCAQRFCVSPNRGSGSAEVVRHVVRGVLHVLAGLLGVALRLVAGALGAQPLVAGLVADVL